MKDLLDERGAGHIKIFGGGGGTILPEEIKSLQEYGIERIYHPDDGREMGLQGMINDLVERSDYKTVNSIEELDGALERLPQKNITDLARSISAAENNAKEFSEALSNSYPQFKNVPVLGITGTGGAGKSSMVDELVRRFLAGFPEKRIGLISVDPSKRKTGGALLGDRIRMNSINNERVYMRSLATRQSNLALSKHVNEALNILKAAEFDLIILETSGIGQSDTEIMEHSDVALYIMTPEFGAATQLEKIDMLDFADVVAINKSDKRGAQDAIRDVRKQFRRNHDLWEVKDEDLPVIGTIASQFNDPGTNDLYTMLMKCLVEKTGADLDPNRDLEGDSSEKIFIIPPYRVRYLSEISETNRAYDRNMEKQAEVAEKLYSLEKSAEQFEGETRDVISARANKVRLELDPKLVAWLEEWPELKSRYKDDVFTFKVRDKEVKVPTVKTSLSHQCIPKISLPSYSSWGDLVRWSAQENLPGSFPYTCLLYTSPSPRDLSTSRMPSSA